MNRRTVALRQFCAVSLALFAALFVVGHCAGCGPSQSAKEAAAEVTYAAELLACVDRSATIEESLICRRGVRAKWHVDGGVR